MNVSCREITDRGHLAPMHAKDALARWASGDGAFWLDVESYDPPALESLLDEVGVQEFLKQRSLRAGVTTVVVAVPQGTFADVVVFADQSCTRRARVSALALPNLLITMKPEPIEDAVPMHEAIESLELRELTTTSIFCALLLEHIATTGRHARTLREEVLDIGRRMDHDIESVEAQELEDIVHSLLLTMAVAEEQEEALTLLANAKSAGFATSELEGTLALLTATAASTERLVQRINDRAENLLRRRQDHKQELLNRRLGLLTIISAIFLPLTLMAGIWGMNFENMPELDEPHAYLVALGLMAFVGLGSAWVLYKRGWFD